MNWTVRPKKTYDLVPFYLTQNDKLYKSNGQMWRLGGCTCAVALYTCNYERINPLFAPLKPQSDGPSYNYSNTVIATLAVDG